MIFIRFCCPIQQRQFTVTLITGSLLLVNKISFYQRRFLSFFLYAPFKAPLLAAAFSALELLFSVSIPFELLASHPSLGSCNIFILNLPLPLKRKKKGKSFSVNKKDCFPSKPVECSSWLPLTGLYLRDSGRALASIKPTAPACHAPGSLTCER